MGTSINWLARLSQEDQERILGHIERLVKLERILSKEILEDLIVAAINDAKQ